MAVRWRVCLMADEPPRGSSSRLHRVRPTRRAQAVVSLSQQHLLFCVCLMVAILVAEMVSLLF